MPNRQNAGFTLTEVMITVALIAILLSIAVPGFQSSIQASRRGDAQHLLLLNAQRLNRCYTLEGVYNGSCVIRADSNDGHYTLKSDLKADTFLLSAVPVTGGSQSKDSKCLTFTYDHTGLQGATGSLGHECW